MFLFVVVKCYTFTLKFKSIAYANCVTGYYSGLFEPTYTGVKIGNAKSRNFAVSQPVASSSDGRWRRTGRDGQNQLESAYNRTVPPPRTPYDAAVPTPSATLKQVDDRSPHFIHSNLEENLAVIFRCSPFNFINLHVFVEAPFKISAGPVPVVPSRLAHLVLNSEVVYLLAAIVSQEYPLNPRRRKSQNSKKEAYHAKTFSSDERQNNKRDDNLSDRDIRDVDKYDTLKRPKRNGQETPSSSSSSYRRAKARRRRNDCSAKVLTKRTAALVLGTARKSELSQRRLISNKLRRDNDRVSYRTSGNEINPAKRGVGRPAGRLAGRSVGLVRFSPLEISARTGRSPGAEACTLVRSGN
ncbi:hypothetical protein Trydic_g17440 [Trypoxylus dichotomus]